MNINSSISGITILKPLEVMRQETLHFKRRIRRIGPKIDIGCKKNPAPGHIGIDVVDFGQDIVWDVGCGLPFPDNSVDSVNMYHFVEHLSREEIAVVFPEILRVCSTGAAVGIACPHSTSKEASYHTHMSDWNEVQVKGLTIGLHGSAPKGGKYFSIEKMDHVGMELRIHLKVHIK